MKVLLAIVTERAMRESLRAALPETDLVLFENSINDAGRRLVSLQADAIVLDDSHGLEGAAFEALSAVAPETPVIVLSARGDSATEAWLRRAGAVQVIGKPFSVQTLRQAIECALPGAVVASPAYAVAKAIQTSSPMLGGAPRAGWSGTEPASPEAGTPARTARQPNRSEERRVPHAAPQPSVHQESAPALALNQHRMALRWLSRSAAHRHDTARLCERLAESAADIFGAVRGAVLLESGATVRVAASLGIPEAVVHAACFSFASGLMRWFDAHACLFDVESLDGQSPRDMALAGDAEKELRLLHGRLAAPLLRDGRVFGAIVLGEKAAGGGYTAEERELLTLVARSASVAFEEPALSPEPAAAPPASEWIEALPAGVVAIAPDLTVLHINAVAERLLGLRAGEAAGRHVSKLGDGLARLVMRVIEEGQALHEQPLAGAMNVRLAVNLRPAPAGGVLAALHASEAGIQESPFWDYLSSRVAQEIKNPMVAINTFAQLLPRKYDSEEFREAFSRVVQKEVNRINGVVETLFSFARNPQPRLRKCSVAETVRGVLASFEEELAARAIQLDTQWDTAEAEAELDPVYFSQALHNVVQNSIDAMPGGGKLHVETRRENGHAEVIVQDTGPGISAEDSEQVFLPFYSTKERGMGLGLPIAQRILRQHRGELKLTAGKQPGSTFEIHIPAAGANLMEQR